MLIAQAFSTLTRLAVLASRVICLIVVVWFVMFALGQSGQASTHQVNEVAEAASGPAGRHATEEAKPSRWQHAVQVAAEAVTAPFAGITSSSSSPWFVHGIDTLLTLLIYGFGFSFLARLITMRV